MARRAKAGWRRAFLKALARTGNATLAARKAGVDKGTAYNLRHRDAGFAWDWARAKAVSRGRVGGDSRFAPAGDRSRAAARESDCPRSSPRSPLILRFNKREGAQLVKARTGPRGWSAESEARFTRALGETGNVRAAAAAAGISTTALYYRRKRYPLLEAAWTAAKEAGCRRVSLMLIDAAEAALDPEVDAEALGLPKVSVAEALAILKAHRFGEAGAPTHSAARAEARARARAVEELPIEAVQAEVIRRIEAVRTHRERREGGDGGPQ